MDSQYYDFINFFFKGSWSLRYAHGKALCARCKYSHQHLLIADGTQPTSRSVVFLESQFSNLYYLRRFENTSDRRLDKNSHQRLHIVPVPRATTPVGAQQLRSIPQLSLGLLLSRWGTCGQMGWEHRTAPGPEHQSWLICLKKREVSPGTWRAEGRGSLHSPGTCWAPLLLGSRTKFWLAPRKMNVQVNRIRIRPLTLLLPSII